MTTGQGAMRRFRETAGLLGAAVPMLLLGLVYAPAVQAGPVEDVMEAVELLSCNGLSGQTGDTGDFTHASEQANYCVSPEDGSASAGFGVHAAHGSRGATLGADAAGDGSGASAGGSASVGDEDHPLPPLDPPDPEVFVPSEPACPDAANGNPFALCWVRGESIDANHHRVYVYFTPREADHLDEIDLLTIGGFGPNAARVRWVAQDGFNWRCELDGGSFECQRHDGLPLEPGFEYVLVADTEARLPDNRVLGLTFHRPTFLLHPALEFQATEWTPEARLDSARYGTCEQPANGPESPAPC